MKRPYDDAIAAHYKGVAEAEGLGATSTMADHVVRDRETRAILDFVAAASAKAGKGVSIVDIGCGNGFTLQAIAERFPECTLTGLEPSADLRALAQSRFTGKKAEVRDGDVRDASSIPAGADIYFCQRVLINVLDPADQVRALDNILSRVPDGAALLFIESFTAPLERLNIARAEFDLPPIPPAHHNLYLPEDFFDRSELAPFESRNWNWPVNFLSTHYFVSRVLHPVMLGERPFKRNSEFTKFFSAALPPFVGDYAQIRLNAFVKPAPSNA